MSGGRLLATAIHDILAAERCGGDEALFSSVFLDTSGCVKKACPSYLCAYSSQRYEEVEIII